MNHHDHSSGNLVADKRADYARQYAQALDYLAATDLMRQSLELAPQWAAGWFRLGEFLEKADDFEAAKNAFQRALDLSKSDYLGAGLKLAYLQSKRLDQAPPAYAEALFDDYAPRFDKALVSTLRYCAPEQLANLLAAHEGQRTFTKALDLGCGTGLMGAVLRHRIEHLTGIDISAAMLEQANSKQIYDALIKADITTALLQFAEVDLVAAADVFMYLADLGPVFSSLANCLRPDGLFLFCTEEGTGPEPWKLQKTMRHAHSAAYVETTLMQNHFEILVRETAMIRMDEGKPIMGLYYLAVRQSGFALHAA